MLPTYRPVYKSSKPETLNVKIWSRDEIEKLKGCFLSTDWDIFFKDTYSDGVTESITACISFCVITQLLIIPQKNIKGIQITNPTSQEALRTVLGGKKNTFKLGDIEGVRTAQKDLNHQMRLARLKHKEQAEEDLSMSNSKKLWDSPKAGTNMEAEKKEAVCH